MPDVMTSVATVQPSGPFQGSMVQLHRMNGTPVWVNADHIRFVEKLPDTTLTFSDGNRFVVREGLEEVLLLMSRRELSFLVEKQ